MKYVDLRILAVMFAMSGMASPLLSTAAEGTKYGKTLVEEHKVPPALVIKYDDLKVERIGQSDAKGPSAIDWFGPTMSVEPSSNPYKLSVRVLGEAKADGDVALVWQGGFRKEDGVTNQTTLLMTQPKVKAGEAVLLEGAMPPLSFKEAQKVEPALSLAVRRNIDVKSVEVKVWSGIPRGSWFEVLLSFWYLWVGLIVLFLWYRWRN